MLAIACPPLAEGAVAVLSGCATQQFACAHMLDTGCTEHRPYLELVPDTHRSQYRKLRHAQQAGPDMQSQTAAWYQTIVDFSA